MSNVVQISEEKKYGVPWCVNCVGLHPNQTINRAEIAGRLLSPQKLIWARTTNVPALQPLYSDMSCMLCGRTYDHAGNLDETWKLTAKRVREEFQRAGVFGIEDRKIELVVAQCRKTFLFLYKNRMKLSLPHWERMTFAGCLANIITHAQEARKRKVNPDFKGPIK